MFTEVMGFGLMTPQQRERMVRLTRVFHLAKEALEARAVRVNNNKPVEFDSLRENWDVWVRLSVPETAMWRAIQEVENQIRETWEDDQPNQ